MNRFNKVTISRFIEVQALLLAPVTPFISEEIWSAIGKKGFIATSDWPAAAKFEVDTSEEIVKSTLEDINSVLALISIKPKKITLFLADKWKYKLCRILEKEIKETRDFGKLMASAMKHNDLKGEGKDVQRIVQKAVKTGIVYVEPAMEEKALRESIGFFKAEFSCEVVLEDAGDSKEAKASQAMPGKPAILVE